MISAITGWNTVEGHLVLGSVVSLFATIAVLSSYIMIVPWRKHPSVLILYRALTSMAFSVNIILNVITSDITDGRGFAFMTELNLLLGECWLTTIAVDLVHSLTNPFISYRYNLNRFTVYNLVFANLVSIIFFFNQDCQGTYESICWIKVDNTTSSPCLWGYYFVWILLMYTYQIYATIFAYTRLQKGLSSSFDIRKQCANDTFKCLSIYAVYLSLLVVFFIVISSNPNPDPNAPINNFALVLLYFVACRGAVDALVWFMLHDFVRRDSPIATTPAISPAAEEEYLPPQLPLRTVREDEDGEVFQSEEEALEGGRKGMPTHPSIGSDDDDYMDDKQQKEFESHLRKRRTRTMSMVDVQNSIKDFSKEVTKGINDIAAASIAEIDEADLSPQVNIALRQQVVQYVTMGVKLAIDNPSPAPIPRTLLKDLSEFIYPTTDFAAVSGLEINEYVLDKEHPFKAFAPKVFQSLRLQEGIEDERYLRTLQSTANERLSEGASGAFMFFCGGGEFIVKTIRDREARVLHASLRKYSRYLRKNKNSLLCRFLGSYSLAMYEQTFYFVVMLNCFDPKAKINERYDIKGSWIGRSADPVKPTKKVVCRHCNELFIPAAKEQCTVI